MYPIQIKNGSEFLYGIDVTDSDDRYKDWVIKKYKESYERAQTSFGEGKGFDKKKLKQSKSEIEQESQKEVFQLCVLHTSPSSYPTRQDWLNHLRKCKEQYEHRIKGNTRDVIVKEVEMFVARLDSNGILHKSRIMSKVAVRKCDGLSLFRSSESLFLYDGIQIQEGEPNLVQSFNLNLSL